MWGARHTLGIQVFGRNQTNACRKAVIFFRYLCWKASNCSRASLEQVGQTDSNDQSKTVFQTPCLKQMCHIRWTPYGHQHHCQGRHLGWSMLTINISQQNCNIGLPVQSVSRDVDDVLVLPHAKVLLIAWGTICVKYTSAADMATPRCYSVMEAVLSHIKVLQWGQASVFRGCSTVPPNARTNQVAFPDSGGRHSASWKYNEEKEWRGPSGAASQQPASSSHRLGDATFCCEMATARGVNRSRAWRRRQLNK